MPDLIGPRIAGGLMAMSLLPLLLMALALPYVVLRLRNEGPSDQQLGLKAGLQSFFSLGIILILAGLTVLTVEWVVRVDSPSVTSSSSELNATQRAGIGLIISGVLFAFLYFMTALVLTDRPNWVRVRRSYAGLRFAIHGLVVMFVGTALILEFMEKRSSTSVWDDDDVQGYFGILLVWLPSWVIHLVLLRFWAEGPSRAPRDEDRERTRYDY